MKTIGLIGGITPQSTIMYYNALNELATQKFGVNHSAKVVINSLDYAVVSRYKIENKWDKLAEMMVEASKNLEKAGVDLLLICNNTMHLSIEEARKSVSIPMLHIAEVIAEEVAKSEMKRVALIGTKHTMEKHIYKDFLKAKNIKKMIPNEEDIKIINDIYTYELSKGIVSPDSREKYVSIISKLVKDGAEGVILGCSEFPLLIRQQDITVPLFDTTLIHAKKAFEIATEHDVSTKFLF